MSSNLTPSSSSAARQASSHAAANVPRLSFMVKANRPAFLGAGRNMAGWQIGYAAPLQGSISRFESGPGLSQTTGRPSGQSFLYRKPLTGANHNLTLPQKRVIFNSFLSSPWVRVTPRPLGYRSTCPRRRIPILKFSRKKARSTRRIRWNLIEKEGRAGHDPAALGVAILRSIQLSYRPKGGTNGAGE